MRARSRIIQKSGLLEARGHGVCVIPIFLVRGVVHLFRRGLGRSCRGFSSAMVIIGGIADPTRLGWP